MCIVDAHVHIFPEEVVRHRERFTARDGWFELLYTPERSRLATVDDLIASMDDAGIDLAVACGFPWRDQGLCDFHNAYLREAAEIHPSRIAWLAIVSPEDGNNALRALEDAFDAGASGVGELNSDAQHFDLAKSSGLDSILRRCIERGRPAMFHVSEPVGHHYPGKGASTPDRLLGLIESYPELRVVAAHWGGGLPFYELMPEVRNIAANVVYDSAASTYLYDHRVFETSIDLVGPDRVLFATDYPVLRQRPLLEKVRNRPGLSDFTLSSVLGDNAVRIYGLEGKCA